jgi:hypothetical protein
MSIYRRTDRVSPNDVQVDQGTRSPVASSDPEPDWTKRRTKEPANGLLKPTLAWASTLPNEIQPRALMQRFPRIANLLAAIWPDPNSFRRYIDDLLVDRRGNRQGFPVEILRELLELRGYYDEQYPDRTMPWEVMSKKA